MIRTTPKTARRSRNERRVTYALKVLGLIVVSAVILGAVLAFVVRVSSVAIVVIGATFFTYVIYPWVRRLSRRVPLGAAIAIVYVTIAIAVGFGVAVVVPALAADAQSLVKAGPGMVRTAQDYLSDPTRAPFRWLPENVRAYAVTLPLQLERLAAQYAGEAARGALGFVLSTVALLATVVVIPVLSVYLMFEWPGVLAGFMRAVPPRARPKTQAVLHDLDRVLGGFIRGQLTVGAAVGIAITLMLLVMHVKYAVLIGVAAGLLDVIPYVGAVVAFVPSVLIALFTDGATHALLVAGLFVVIFQLEGHVIAPRIVSDSVGLTPLAVIIAILIGAELGGPLGMFLAVPVAAVLRVLFLHAIPRYAADRRAGDASATAETLTGISAPGAKKAEGLRA